MIKRLLTVLVVTISALTTHQVNAQAHKGVPIQHTPVIEVKHVPKPVQKAYDEVIENSFLFVTGEPHWTRQNGLLVASVPATDEMLGPGVGIFRFKPYGGLVLIDFIADQPSQNDND